VNAPVHISPLMDLELLVRPDHSSDQTLSGQELIEHVAGVIYLDTTELERSAHMISLGIDR